METQAYFEDIQYYLLKELRKAESSILAAIAWFTDKDIYDLLCQKAGEGIKVELILFNDDINKGPFGLNFDLLKSKQGTVYFIGNGTNSDNIMHNKFCIIDNLTIITGSYNWSRRAQNNYENITIIKENPELANQFFQEFYNIKNKCAEGKPCFISMDYSKVKRRMETIKNVILLEDKEDIKYQTEKLKKLIPEHYIDKNINMIKQCIAYLEGQLYSDAVRTIDEFLSRFQHITIYEDPEIIALKLEIKSLEIQLSSLADEKTEIEKTIRLFEIRHNEELGPIIMKILELRKARLKKEAEEDINKQTEYEEAEKDYKTYKEGYEEGRKKKINILTEEQQREIKNKFRKASKICHPDIVIDELKDQANAIFQELANAYEENDLGKVNNILENLEKGKWLIPKTEKLTEKVKLEAQVMELRRNINNLIIAINQLKESKTYQLLKEIGDWDAYFNETREHLLEELNNLEQVNV